MLAILNLNMDKCFAACTDKINRIVRMLHWILSNRLRLTESRAYNRLTELTAYVHKVEPIFCSTQICGIGPFCQLSRQWRAYFEVRTARDEAGNLSLNLFLGSPIL